MACASTGSFFVTVSTGGPSAPGQALDDRYERLQKGFGRRDVRDAQRLASRQQQVAHLVWRAHQKEGRRGLLELGRVETEAGQHLRMHLLPNRHELDAQLELV